MTWIDFMWGFYLVPTVIAWLRFHRRAALLTAINVFAGWTLIGWVVVLGWAIRGQASGPAVRSVDRSQRYRVSWLVGALCVWALLFVPAFLVAWFLALAGGGGSGSNSVQTAGIAIMWVFGWPVVVIAIVKIVQRWMRGLDPMPHGSQRECPTCGRPVSGGKFCTTCGASLRDGTRPGPAAHA